MAAGRAALARGARGLGEAARGARPGDACANSSAASLATIAPALDAAIDALKRGYAEKPQNVATRKASELALDAINAALPETIGGSADLTPSNNTKTKGLEDVAPGNFGGRYIRYGIREHGMAAAMNGMALHGGLIPYGGTFLIFSDYCRPAIRLAALMGHARHLRDDARFRSGSARTGRRTSRSSIWRRSAPCRTSWSTARPTRWRRRNAGSSRCTTAGARA